MLKSAHTLIASSMASSDRRQHAGGDVGGPYVVRPQRQLLEESQCERSFAAIGALRQSSSTAFTTLSSFRANDATAPWDSVQKTHLLRREVNAANSSRSPTLHSDGSRITACVQAHCGAPKNSAGTLPPQQKLHITLNK